MADAKEPGTSPLAKSFGAVVIAAIAGGIFQSGAVFWTTLIVVFFLGVIMDPILKEADRKKKEKLEREAEEARREEEEEAKRQRRDAMQQEQAQLEEESLKGRLRERVSELLDYANMLKANSEQNTDIVNSMHGTIHELAKQREMLAAHVRRDEMVQVDLGLVFQQLDKVGLREDGITTRLATLFPDAAQRFNAGAPLTSLSESPASAPQPDRSQYH